MSAKNYMLAGSMAVMMVVLPGAAHSASTLPFSISGVPTGGYPNFDFSAARVTLERSGANFQLTANYSYLNPTVPGPDTIQFRVSPTEAYAVFNPSFALSAVLDSSGNLVGNANTVTISGGITNYNGSAVPEQTLFSANLVNYGADTTPGASPVAVGFKIDANSFSGWATQFSAGVDESVYLYNFPVSSFVNAFSSGGFSIGSWNGSAATTVPIPGAAWLFGSAVAVLSAARRKKPSSAT